MPEPATSLGDSLFCRGVVESDAHGCPAFAFGSSAEFRHATWTGFGASSIDARPQLRSTRRRPLAQPEPMFTDPQGGIYIMTSFTE